MGVCARRHFDMPWQSYIIGQYVGPFFAGTYFVQRICGRFMIRLSQVTFSYAPDACPVITGLSTVFDASTHTVVAGPDGSGKTTLAKLIKGSLAPTSGEIATDVDRTTEIGYVGQDPNDFIVGATIEEDVVFGLENIGASRSEMRHRLELALDRTGLSGMENRLTHSLSGGRAATTGVGGMDGHGLQGAYSR